MKQKNSNCLTKQCKVCKEVKYDRHRPNPEISETPVPNIRVTQITLTYSRQKKKLALTTIDKFFNQ